jgi:hypothetical protein
MAYLRPASFLLCLVASVVIIGVALYGVYVSDSYHSLRCCTPSGLVTESHESIWEREPLVAIRTTIGYVVLTGSPAVLALMNMRQPTSTKVFWLWVMAVLNAVVFTVAFLSTAPFIAPGLLFVVAAFLATAASKPSAREPLGT